MSGASIRTCVPDTGCAPRPLERRTRTHSALATLAFTLAAACGTVDSDAAPTPPKRTSSEDWPTSAISCDKIPCLRAGADVSSPATGYTTDTSYLQGRVRDEQGVPVRGRVSVFQQGSAEPRGRFVAAVGTAADGSFQLPFPHPLRGETTTILVEGADGLRSLPLAAFSRDEPEDIVVERVRLLPVTSDSIRPSTRALVSTCGSGEAASARGPGLIIGYWGGQRAPPTGPFETTCLGSTRSGSTAQRSRWRC